MSKDLTEALRELTERREVQARDGMEPRGAAGAAKSAARLPGSNSGEGGGVTSPLVETDYAVRTWHANRTIQSTDGLFWLTVRPVKKITFNDGKNNPVTIEFKAPT